MPQFEERMPRIKASSAALAGFALFAFCWVIARACLQSVTIDEADSWLLFASRDSPSLWWPSSGNHILNTLLVRLATSVFGLSELTLRLPAILGAAIYIVSALWACLRLTTSPLLRLPLFVCLVYNPLVFDFLVAARGYSLALGFFMAGLAVLAATVLDDAPAQEPLVAASIFLGLSFCANFSFGIATVVTLLAFTVWTWRRAGSLSIVAASVLPYAAVVFCLCGYTLLNWPKGQLYFGSHSVYETTRGLIHSSYFEINPNIVQPLLRPALARLAQLLWPAAFSLGLALLGIAIARRAWTPLIALLLSILTFTVLLHWIAFHVFQVLLPQKRTGLFLIPLVLLLFVALVATGPQVSLRLGAALLILNSLCCLACLRLRYFEEWKYDADVKQLYWTLNYLHRRCGVDHFVTEWPYSATLNFYRQADHGSALPEFTASTGSVFPPNGEAYVLYYPNNQQFVKQQKLQLFYYGEDTQAAIAVRAPACAKIEVP
jgi:hypothetical protein